MESLSLFEERPSDKIAFLLDAVVGLLGAERNDIFKALTVRPVVGIAPTLIAGVYG